MGRNARKFSVQATFFGADYESRLQTFITALDQRGSAILVHPVFGNIDKAQVADYRIHHEADNRDSCNISIEFEESVPAQAFFSRQLASQKADAIDSAATAAGTASAAVLTKQFGSVAALADNGSLSALSRVNALRGQATALLTNLNAEVHGIVSSTADPIRGAIGFVADLTALSQSLIDAVPNTLEFLQNYAKTTFERADRLLSPAAVTLPGVTAPSVTPAVAYPVSSAQLAADAQVLTTHIAVQRAVVKAQVVSLVLASESSAPTLTPQQLESLVNTARAAINDAMATARSRYGADVSRIITEPLKTLALSVQESSRAVILARPPLLARTISTPAPLRLLAHYWYGDHTRSLEIVRLNNLRLPNALNVGDVLNVYSK